MRTLPASRSVHGAGDVEDDLLGLDLAVVVDQVQARARRLRSGAERAAGHGDGEGEQGVVLVASAGQDAQAAWQDRLGVGGQAFHVGVGSGQVSVGRVRRGGGGGDPDIGRERAAGGVEVVAGPCPHVRGGDLHGARLVFI